MKPRRRPSRHLSETVFARTLQIIRLERIAKGEAEPISLRECCFQWHLQTQGHVRMDDFIVPWPLLRAESAQIQVEQEDDDADTASAPTMDIHAKG